MNCEYFEPLISDLVDGELAPDQTKLLEEHLTSCDDCRVIMNQFAQLNGLYSQIEAPAAIKENITKSVRNQKRGVHNMVTKGLMAKNLSIAAMAAVFFMMLYLASALKEAPVNLALKKHAAELPAVGSYKNLKKLLAANINPDRKKDGIGMTFGGMSEKSLSSEDSAVQNLGYAPGSDTGYSLTKPEFSKTNTQVQGVDEADIVKTDGKYIYQVNAQQIKIVEAHPAQDMKLVETIKLVDKEMVPSEVYLDDKYLTVIGSSYQSIAAKQPAQAEAGKKGPESLIYPGDGEFMQEMVKVRVYDITDKSNIKMARDLEVTGGLVSSRKIGSSVYLVTNKYLDTYRIMEQKAEKASDADMPTFKDSKGTNRYTTQSFKDIRYLPGSQASNYMIIAGINLDKPEKEAKISSYLGAGENIYSSTENLYVAVREMEDQPKPESSKDPDKPTDNITNDRKFIQVAPSQPVSENTAVYKFSLNDGEATYSGKGKVPGSILNQFSMDEFGNNFRIATTKGENWDPAEDRDPPKSMNNIYVLNDDLKTVGKLEGLAPGERIYSARFMGDRAYMVTFRQTDPLFVIDLKNARAPKVLGELKIPGFSNYLHPYDESHIIGFGKDADEKTGMTGGLKVAMFDVSNVNKPVEKFKTIIGGSGTESPLLHDHKALLFDKEKNLMAFPITIWENSLVYNNYSFAGAYVYDVSPESGLKLKGKITHQRTAQKRSTKPREYDRMIVDSYRREIQRILYIDKALYTLSQEQVSAHDIDDIKEIKSLSLSK